MAGRINDEDVHLLRERADIAEVVGSYTSLRRAGSRLKGLCPFHQENTPSFTVDQARGLFHCFGCQAGGDVYAFLQQAEALTFPEAVERLAGMVGYPLRYEELSPGQRRVLGRRTRLTQALGEAADFYARCLAGADGAAARDYLRLRGLGSEQVERFRLGWAPDEWDGLSRHLRRAGFADDEIVAAGLAIHGRRGAVDRFRGRVLYPIVDPGGREVLGFGGRLLPHVRPRTAPRDGAPPKYINSPETEVYRKSRTLYGVNWARAEMQRRDAALVVEGYMDVIALHGAGVRHAVATCGTALTAEHLRLLQRFAQRVVLALDADQAGYAAADRARALAEEVGVREIGVLSLPAGQDPADLAAGGVGPVERALAEVKTAVQYQIEHLLRDADTSTPEGKVHAYRRTFPLLARIDDRFLRYSYVRDTVAPAVRLSADMIERELDAELVGRARRSGPEPSSRAPRGPTRQDNHLVMEREVLRSALQNPELLPVEWKLINENDFTADVSRQLFRVLGDSPPGELEAVLAALPDDAIRGRVRALALSEPTVSPDPARVASLVGSFLAASLRRQLDQVKREMATLREQMSPEQRRQLMSRYFELCQRIDQLGRRGA